MASLAEMIEPMPGRIAVQVKAAEEIRGGLYLPEAHVRSMHEQKPVQGVIVSLGPSALDDADFEDEEAELKVGDTVVFGKYSGVELSYQPEADLEEGEQKAGPYAKPKPPRERIVLLQFKDILCRIKTPTDAIKVRG